MGFNVYFLISWLPLAQKATWESITSKTQTGGQMEGGADKDSEEEINTEAQNTKASRQTK